MQTQMPQGQEPIDYFLAGYRANEAGLPCTSCPLLFKAWPRMAWLDGFAYYDEINKIRRKPITDELLRIESEPYEQGKAAYINNIEFADCPYSVDTGDGLAWQNGWLDQSKTCAQSGFPFLIFAAICLAIVGAIVYFT